MLHSISPPSTISSPLPPLSPPSPPSPPPQVCALQWSQHERELLSSHGYSQNQLCLWRYPSMTKMAEVSGHTARVLHLAQVRVLKSLSP